MTYKEALHTVEKYMELISQLHNRRTIIAPLLVEYHLGYDPSKWYSVESIERLWEDEDKEQYIVTLSFEWSGEDGYLSVPLEYFFLPASGIQHIVEAKRQERKQKKKQQAEKREREKEAQQRALYERLKEKFEGGNNE